VLGSGCLVPHYGPEIHDTRSGSHAMFGDPTREFRPKRSVVSVDEIKSARKGAGRDGVSAGSGVHEQLAL
jgi:hypothetical protein